jgi:hypothetical protein
MKIQNAVEDGVFYNLSKKAILVLENLIKTDQVETPIKFSVLFDISIGALAESEVIDRIQIIDIFTEDPQLLYDTIEFTEIGEYNLHDVLSQVICFRVIKLMQDFLDHIDIEYESFEEENEEDREKES